MEAQIIKVKDDGVVNFIGITPEYGRAEFDFCPVYEDRQITEYSGDEGEFIVTRKRIVELFIIPRQQPDKRGIIYHLDQISCDSLILSGSYSLNDPKIWRHWWCEHHKTPSFSAYVPDGATSMRIDVLSTLHIWFE